MRFTITMKSRANLSNLEQIRENSAVFAPALSQSEGISAVRSLFLQWSHLQTWKGLGTLDGEIDQQI